MALDIIGSGFGRTGTTSLRAALELLGFGPCHHMEVIFDDPTRIDAWTAFANGTSLDLDQVFDGFRAQVDWPGAAVWKDLALRYPQAKVIHSHRPEDKWWKSFDATIGLLLERYSDLDLPPHIKDMMRAMDVVIGQGTFGGNYRDQATAIDAYRARAAEVAATIPADRLLVFDVAEGWQPLCDFLEVDVPDVPFPRLNDKVAFWADAGGPPAPKAG